MSETATMAALVLTGHGGPERLEYRDAHPMPRPGPGEVLVKVGACGLNHSDVWVREGRGPVEGGPAPAGGWRRRPIEFPRIQGSDVVGFVASVGAEVPVERVGERVIVNPALYGREAGEGLLDAGLLGSDRDGGFAEYVTVPAENALPVDSPFGDAELATLPMAALTAMRMLHRVDVTPGETVLVTGASGGVGSALVQIAVAQGARAVAVVARGREKAMRELGASVVVRRDEPDLPAAVEESLGGAPVDVVADLVGGASVSELLRVLRPGGRYVVAGAVGGPQVGIDLRVVYLKHLELVGSTLGTRRDFQEVVRYVEEGKLVPRLAATFPLRDLARAQAELVEGGHAGKLVIEPTPPPDA